MGSDELIRVTGELQRLLRRAEALAVKVVGEVDLRGAAVARGEFDCGVAAVGSSPPSWRRQTHGRHRHVVHGHPGGPLVPTEEVTAPHALLRRDFAEGLVCGEHVQVVTAVLDALPAGVHAVTRADAQATAGRPRPPARPEGAHPDR